MSKSMRALVAIVASALALAVVATAIAAPGGRKGDPTLAIATQSPGSVTFSVLVPDSKQGPPSLVVTATCYDANSIANYSSSMNVAWSTSTVGFAGVFAPPSGEPCYAFAHAPGSDVPAPGATFSFTAP